MAEKTSLLQTANEERQRIQEENQRLRSALACNVSGGCAESRMLFPKRPLTYSWRQGELGAEEVLGVHDQERNHLHSEILILQMAISNLEVELKTASDQVRSQRSAE